MTIKVRVTNEDVGDTRIIGVQVVYPNTEDSPIQELKGGQSTELYVHSTQHILVKEVRNG